MPETDDQRRARTAAAREAWRSRFASEDDYRAWMTGVAKRSRIARKRRSIDDARTRLDADLAALEELCRPHHLADGQCRLCGFVEVAA